MNAERRYDEEEIDRIFRIAAEARDSTGRGGGSGPGTGSGMTLRELQEIGEEVGISRKLVARAASSLDTGSGRTRMVRTLGAPTGVERSVALVRPVTDTEWERLVARLRRTFRAQGRVEVMGGLKQWSNGNLQVSLEPGESGYQLRMQTFKGNLRPVLSMAFSMVLAALVLVVVSLVAGTAINMLGPALLAAVGVGVGVLTVGGLPGWAERRARQMDEIADLAQEWTALPPPEE